MTNSETAARQRRPKEETARLGDEIYRRDIRAQVEADHDGEYVAIDVNSGNWAIAESELAASDLLLAQCPDAIDVWLLRVGLQGGGQHWGRLSAEGRVVEGTVNAAYEAVVALPLRGPAGQARDVDAVVDTGFTRFLTLPPTMVAQLGLGSRGVNRVNLADGSEATLEVYGVTVLWDGQPREVVAYASDTTPLIGMSLLHRHNLNIDVEDGGRVLIQAKE